MLPASGVPALPAALVPAESSWLEQLLWRNVRGGFLGAGPVGSGAFKASSILQQSDLHISNLHISDLFEVDLHGVSAALGFLFSVKSSDFGPVRNAGLRLLFSFFFLFNSKERTINFFLQQTIIWTNWNKYNYLMLIRLCIMNPPDSYSIGDPFRLDTVAPLLLQLLQLVLLLRLLSLLDRSNILRIDCTLTRLFSSIVFGVFFPKLSLYNDMSQFNTFPVF